MPEATWPDGPVPQQLRLDATVPTVADFDVAHERALAPGARLIQDRSDDPEEPLRVYADRLAPVLPGPGRPGERLLAARPDAYPGQPGPR